MKNGSGKIGHGAGCGQRMKKSKTPFQLSNNKGSDWQSGEQFEDREAGGAASPQP
jgi:hypothetical protein